MRLSRTRSAIRKPIPAPRTQLDRVPATRTDYTTSYTYNALGLPVAVADALGNQTTYAYDDKGRQLSVTTPEGGVTSFEYDARKNIVPEHTKVSDSATATTKHTYSKAGKLLENRRRAGRQEKPPFMSTMPAALPPRPGRARRTVTTEYGTNGEPLKRTDANSNETTMNMTRIPHGLSVTDAEGATKPPLHLQRSRPAYQTTDAEGNATTYEYDALDRVAKDD
ncbi:hypothetical protein [Agathobaculum butyriciproducens]|uniref:hypothetical protein n=1 Tax=Agathobaculum butyriciproducens TaxID=1628085 RepID=UPI0036D24695